MWFLRNAWLIPLIPAVSFFVILLFGKRLPMKGSDVGVVAVGASLLLSLGCVVQWIRLGHTADHLRQPIERHITWWQSGGVKFQAGIHVDGLAVMMLFVVSFISFLVHVYSTAYMEGD